MVAHDDHELTGGIGRAQLLFQPFVLDRVEHAQRPDADGLGGRVDRVEHHQADGLAGHRQRAVVANAGSGVGCADTVARRLAARSL